MKKDTRQRLLDLVLARLGWKNTEQRLGIDTRTLDGWLGGTKRIPDDKVRELIDIIDETAEG